ncbi:MAG: hypothetical protein WBA05_03770 [Gordonia sp. (in: high G+C Gram-positive bacteria)]|uniref:hypothetical protein n=1 Tax=Gordonia TaxID=2053 RepID=UPI00326492EC
MAGSTAKTGGRVDLADVRAVWPRDGCTDRAGAAPIEQARLDAWTQWNCVDEH